MKNKKLNESTHHLVSVDVKANPGPILISGDGDCIFEIVDISPIGYISRSVESLSSNCIIYKFKFSVNSPIRINTVFLVPIESYNSCVTLNDRLLIGLFSTEIPPDNLLPRSMITKIKSGDTHGHDTISTLGPGKLQHISFKWENEDLLQFYIYFNN